jgi:hypothetical protein
MSEPNLIVAVYANCADVEAAVNILQEAGFDLTAVSIVGKEYHSKEEIVGYYDSGDHMKYWGSMEPFWGGLWKLLARGAFFVLPALGPVLIAGPLAPAVVAGLEGPAVPYGASALGTGLYSLGIPGNRILHYENRLLTGDLLLIMRGTAGEVRTAHEALASTQPYELNRFLTEEPATAFAHA